MSSPNPSRSNAPMRIDGWIALGLHGPILGSFREDQDQAELAARRILQLAGGPGLVAGFDLVPATLIVSEESDETTKSNSE